MKTVGKDGAHPLAVFTKTITVNLIGSFNIICLAAEAMAKSTPESTGGICSRGTPPRRPGWRAPRS